MNRFSISFATLMINFLLIIECCQMGHCQPSSPPRIEPAHVNVKPSKIKRITPGTLIGDTAPEGWTYLLFKNESEIGTGDLDSATELTKNLVSLFNSAMVANVIPNATRTKYILGDIGYGIYTKTGSSNVVVTSDTYKDLGAPLGFLQAMGLSRTEKRVDQLSISARTGAMAIVDSKSMVLLENKHFEIMVRHAILLDQKTGKIATLIWFFLPETVRKPGRVLSKIDVVEPNSLTKLVVHIDRSEFSLGVVTERALALDRMNWGPKQIAFPKDLEPQGSPLLFSEESVMHLEIGLRRIASP